MNEEKQVLKLAAERLLAVANGATLEWCDNSSRVGLGTSDNIIQWANQHIRIRPPAVAPEPKPSQAVLDACKRLGVEAWKLDRYKTGDHTLHPGAVHNDGEDGYERYKDFRVLHADHDQRADSTCRYWHVRPIAATLPCPPKPTPEQVAAARMPDGRRVKEPTVCEVPNGRAWIYADRVYVHTPPETSSFGLRRWIAEPADEAEPADAVVEPWTLGPEHAGKVVVRKDGCGWGVITHSVMDAFHISGYGNVTPEQLLRDWIHNGQPCGVAK